MSEREYKYKITSMDLSKSDIPMLKEYIKDLESEHPLPRTGITIPIKSRVQYLENGEFYQDEWELSDSWDPKDEEKAERKRVEKELKMG